MLRSSILVATFVTVVIIMTNTVSAQFSCNYPFVNSANGQSFTSCYHFRGDAVTYSSARDQCSREGTKLVTVKDSNGLKDLYKLYKAYPNFYFWLGATSSPSRPKDFRWQDGTPVNKKYWCKNHPKGGDNTCSFYSTKAVIGRDKCIKSGPCGNNFFDHGVICHWNPLYDPPQRPQTTTRPFIGTTTGPFIGTTTRRGYGTTTRRGYGTTTRRGYGTTTRYGYGTTDW